MPVLKMHWGHWPTLTEVVQVDKQVTLGCHGCIHLGTEKVQSSSQTG